MSSPSTRMKPLTVENLLSRVEKKPSGCWEWLGHRSKYGYGLRWREGKRWSVNRLVFHLQGRLLSKDEFVCHKCDNPPCCNPEHLFIGSNRDNTKDKVAKGRQAKKERSAGVKLTEAQILEIRNRYYNGGVTQKSLGQEYGVSQVRIGSIVRNEAWMDASKPRKNFRHLSSKLTQEVADKIREEYSFGKFSQRELGDRYKVHKSLVSLIINNKIWKTKNA